MPYIRYAVPPPPPLGPANWAKSPFFVCDARWNEHACSCTAAAVCDGIWLAFCCPFLTGGRGRGRH